MGCCRQDVINLLKKLCQRVQFWIKFAKLCGVIRQATSFLTPVHFLLRGQYPAAWAADEGFGLRGGSLTEHLLITTGAVKPLVQCDSKPVKAAATARQPALSATRQSVKLAGTHRPSRSICTHNLTCRHSEVCQVDLWRSGCFCCLISSIIECLPSFFFRAAIWRNTFCLLEALN